MFPRKSLASGQEFAQGFGGGEIGFAQTGALRDDALVSGALRLACAVGQDCYPFPSTWPAPNRGRSFFFRAANSLRRLHAVCVSLRDLGFDFAVVVVESLPRTTTKRGSSKCGKPFFLSPFSPCRWLAACKILRRVALLALRLVRRLLTLPTTTLLPALSSAALQALQPVASIWACRPATDLIAASAAYLNTASRGNPPTGRFYLSRPGQTKGESHV